jgi:hypothetical protein
VVFNNLEKGVECHELTTTKANALGVPCILFMMNNASLAIQSAMTLF